MKLSPEEKAAHQAAFRASTPAEKAEHIFTYYKWHILLALVALLILGSVVHRQVTQREPALYLAFLNLSAGSEAEGRLSDGYLTARGRNLKREEVYLYRNLYLSTNADTLNHEYAYASQMKLLAAINAQRLDVVLMNREAYDILSGKGYLLPLSLPEELRPLAVENAVVLSDNTIEVLLGEAEKEEIVTRNEVNAIAVTALPLFQEAGFDGALYAGIIANAPHPDTALDYLCYLSEEEHP